MIGKLARRSLRHRTGGFLATFLALALGATIVMACGGLMETGIRNNVPPQRLAGAQILVTGERTYRQPGEKHAAVLPERAGIPAESVERAGRLPGVRRAVGERTFDVVLAGTGGKAEAHGWESAALTPYGLDGAAPRPGEVVLDTGLAARTGKRVGDTVRIAARGGGATAAYRLSGIARSGQVPRPTLFFATADAERLDPHPGTVADTAIVTGPGADRAAVRERVREALPGLTVLTGDDRGTVEHPEAVRGSGDLIALSGVFGGLAVAVSVFVVAGTVGLCARQRRRELALLRAVGAGKGMLRRMIVGETLLVAVLAAAAAWFAGPVAGRRLFEALVDSGMAAETLEFRQGWIPAMPAFGALLLTAVGGGLLGARGAVAARPVEALGEAAVQERWFTPVRLLLGLLFLAGTAALGIVTALVLHGPVAASTAGPTVMCAAVGLALLGPWFTRAVTALLHWPVRLLTGASGRLAVLNCRATPVRTAAVATPVMLVTALATGMIYLQTGTAALTGKAFTDGLRADAVLTSPAGVDPALAAAVRRLPEVGAASAYVTSTGYTESPHDGAESKRGLPLRGVGADGAERTVGAKVTAGSLAALRGDTIALPEPLARRIHRGVGDTLRLRLGDGAAVDVRVVALVAAREGYEQALTSVELLAPHTTRGVPAQIMVRAADGTGRDALMAALTRFAGRHPGLAVQDRDALAAGHAADTRTQAWVNYLVVGMLVVYTGLSVVNSTAVAVGNRRKEFALQRLTGATKGQLLRMMAVEGSLTALAGVVLGTLAAAAALVPFSLSASDRVLPYGPVTVYLGVVAGAVAVTLAATLLPAWAVLRVRPVEAAGGQSGGF
ncbi:ABC transporter permease [Streptomyces luteireticuli]|uniref:ABC transporter permease n=1 Tax=Streptomyces luteireticuli TaxID=173858 RepID=UPI003558A05F